MFMAPACIVQSKTAHKRNKNAKGQETQSLYVANCFFLFFLLFFLNFGLWRRCIRFWLRLDAECTWFLERLVPVSLYWSWPCAGFALASILHLVYPLHDDDVSNDRWDRSLCFRGASLLSELGLVMDPVHSAGSVVCLLFWGSVAVCLWCFFVWFVGIFAAFKFVLHGFVHSFFISGCDWPVARARRGNKIKSLLLSSFLGKSPHWRHFYKSRKEANLVVSKTWWIGVLPLLLLPWVLAFFWLSWGMVWWLFGPCLCFLVLFLGVFFLFWFLFEQLTSSFHPPHVVQRSYRLSPLSRCLR